MMEIQMKICPKCGPKPIDDFYNNKAKKDGKSGSCKVCDKAAMHERFKKIGKYKGIFRIWTEADKEYLRKNYATADMKVMIAFLTNTTAQKIRQRAVYLGLGGTRKAHIYAEAKKKLKKKRVYKYIPKPKKLPVLKVLPDKKKVIEYHKELPRFVEKKYETREVDAAALAPFRIDGRTILYLPLNMSDERRNEVISRYQKKTA